MVKTEICELPFVAKIDKRNRVQIPHDVAQTATLREGDTVVIILRQVIRKEA